MDPIQILEDAKDSISSVYISSYEIITGSIDEHVRTYDIRAGRLRTDAIGGKRLILLFTYLGSSGLVCIFVK